jgi:predicted enzyme related to lactoylglutathione lyase
MHRSRLVGLIIDCQGKDIDAAATFWSKALGRPVQPSADDSPNYRFLATRENELLIGLQRVDHPSRVHLDIESDDVDAEAARLEKLGARRVVKTQTWWVMEAPSGQRFCVVRPQGGPLDKQGNEWPG